MRAPNPGALPRCARGYADLDPALNTAQHITGAGSTAPHPTPQPERQKIMYPLNAIYRSRIQQYAATSDFDREPEIQVTEDHGVFVIWLTSLEGDYIVAAHAKRSKALEDAILMHRLRSVREIAQNAIKVQA